MWTKTIIYCQVYYFEHKLFAKASWTVSEYLSETLAYFSEKNLLFKEWTLILISLIRLNYFPGIKTAAQYKEKWKSHIVD